MIIINILTFFGSFILIILVTLCIFLNLYNKRTLTTTEKFISQASALMPTVIQNIKLRYWTTNGARTMLSPNNHCDLYLFDNCLAIIRKQDFIFKVFFAPVIITSDVTNSKNVFNYLDIYKPVYINFNRYTKGVIEIKLPDSTCKTIKIDITLKGLTDGQINQLEKIKNWCNN